MLVRHRRERFGRTVRCPSSITFLLIVLSFPPCMLCVPLSMF